jgi:putative membrane protein
MRYLKVLALVALFFFSLLFFIQNHEVLMQELSLRLELFGWEYQTEKAPFYLMVLMAFVIGAVACTLYFFLERVRFSRQSKQLQKEVDNLTHEVASLRSAAAAETAYVSAEHPEQTQG